MENNFAQNRPHRPAKAEDLFRQYYAMQAQIVGLDEQIAASEQLLEELKRQESELTYTYGVAGYSPDHVQSSIVSDTTARLAQEYANDVADLRYRANREHRTIRINRTTKLELLQAMKPIECIMRMLSPQDRRMVELYCGQVCIGRGPSMEKVAGDGQLQWCTATVSNHLRRLDRELGNEIADVLRRFASVPNTPQPLYSRSRRTRVRVERGGVLV